MIHGYPVTTIPDGGTAEHSLLFAIMRQESAFERGSLAGTSRWTAILTIAVRPPRSADVLRRNPLGL